MSSDMLNQLDEWLANGDIDEETYNKLKEKYGSKKEAEAPKPKEKRPVTVRMTPPILPKEEYHISTGAIVIGLFFILFGAFWVLSILSYEPFKTIFDNVKSSFGEPLTACFCLFGMIVLFLIGLMLVVNSMRRRFKPVETGLGTLLIVLAVMLFLHTYHVMVFDWWLLFACCVLLLGIVLIAGAFKKRKRPSSWREWMNWTEWMEWD
jgi:peptidoglycan/LPS O-acetylase OafA/YrhL